MFENPEEQVAFREIARRFVVRRFTEGLEHGAGGD
jgi:hypothetical protein